MAATNHSWTISDTGCANGPEGENDKLPGGQINFMPTLEGGTLNGVGARDDVPYNYDFKRQIDFSGAPDRVDVPTGLEGYGCPNPQTGDMGQPIDFNAVAPDFEEPNVTDLDGGGAPGASKFAFGDGTPA